MKFGELFPDFLFALRQLLRDLNLRCHKQIATSPGGSRQPVTAQAKALSALRSSRKFQTRASLQSRHLKLAAQRSLPRGNFRVVKQIAALDDEIRMTRQPHTQKEIAAFSAAFSRFPLAREANALTFMHAFRDLDLVTFQLVRIAPAQGNSSFRSVKRFLKRDHDVGFDVAASFGSPGPLPKTAAAKPALSPSASEKLLKEIAESGSAEFEFYAAAIPAARAAKTAARWLRAQPGGC